MTGQPAYVAKIPARQILAWLPATIAVGAALYMIVLLIRALFATHSAMPFMDQFSVATPDRIMNLLFVRHNEHLILLPRLGFLLDLTLTRGSNALNILTIVLIQLAHATLLAWIVGAARFQHLDPIALGLALCCSFSAVQYENLAWGFQTQFVGVFAFASACFATVLMAGGGIGATLTACLLGAAAALTMANGVLVLPIVAVVALIAGHPWRQVLPLAIAALLVTAIFAATYSEISHHSSPTEALRHPLRIALYVAIYFGAPLAKLLQLPSVSTGSILSGASLGGAGMLVAGLFGLRALLIRHRIASGEWVFFGILAFLLATAGITAAGRHTFGFDQATSPRYATPALLFWCSLLLWFWLLTVRRGPRRVQVVASALAGIAVFVASQQARALLGLEAFVAPRYGAETALLAGVDDKAAFLRMSPDTDEFRGAVEELRTQGLSIFSTPYAAWMGSALNERVHLVSADHCRGQIERAERNGTGEAPFVTAEGWAWNSGDGSLITRVFLVDSSGRIAGFGRGPLRRRDLARSIRRSIRDERIGWTGHAAVGPGATLRAFGLIGSNVACPLQGEIQMEP